MPHKSTEEDRVRVLEQQIQAIGNSLGVVASREDYLAAQRRLVTLQSEAARAIAEALRESLLATRGCQAWDEHQPGVWRTIEDGRDRKRGTFRRVEARCRRCGQLLRRTDWLDLPASRIPLRLPTEDS